MIDFLFHFDQLFRLDNFYISKKKKKKKNYTQ